MSELLMASIQALVICVVLYLTLIFLNLRKAAQKRGDIQYLEAKMSSLRMKLKGKVRKKSTFIRSCFGPSIKYHDPIDLLLNALSAQTFETSFHFQNYFELSKRLNGYRLLHEEKNKKISENEPSENPENSASKLLLEPAIDLQKFEEYDFMTADLQNEFAILRLMAEMVQLSHKIKERTRSFNDSQTKIQLPFSETFYFPAVADINRLLSEHPESFKANKNSAA